MLCLQNTFRVLQSSDVDVSQSVDKIKRKIDVCGLESLPISSLCIQENFKEQRDAEGISIVVCDACGVAFEKQHTSWTVGLSLCKMRARRLLRQKAAKYHIRTQKYTK